MSQWQRCFVTSCLKLAVILVKSFCFADNLQVVLNNHHTICSKKVPQSAKGLTEERSANIIFENMFEFHKV